MSTEFDNKHEDGLPQAQGQTQDSGPGGYGASGGEPGAGETGGNASPGGFGGSSGGYGAGDATRFSDADLKYAPKKVFAAFNGVGAELFGIMIVNFIFTLLTLGIYHFWGKVKVRKYLWQHSNILGSPLEYTGNGLELFISFLIVIVALTGYSLLMSATLLFGIITLPLLFWAIYFAMYRSIRFRLTRTRWRGIYANLSGSAVSFANNVIFLSIANILCLGCLTPYITARLYRLTMNNVWWGDMRFSFSGTAKPLYKSFFIGMGVTVVAIILLAVFGAGYFMVIARAVEQGYAGGAGTNVDDPALMLVLLYFGAIFMIAMGFMYYAACKVRWFYDHLSLPGARFTCGLPLTVFISLYITNTLLLLFTLGLGYPWVLTRTLRCLTSAAVYQGDVNVDAIQQNTQSIPKRGDGLLDALDLDVAF